MIFPLTNHEAFMQLALAEAEQALRENEVPIGAVIVDEGRVIASAPQPAGATSRPHGPR